MIGRDPECAEMRIVASIVSNQINKMCDSPLLQSKMAMYVCMYVQLHSYTRACILVLVYLHVPVPTCKYCINSQLIMFKHILYLVCDVVLIVYLYLFVRA